MKKKISKEKKDFMDSDLVDRLIKIEQKISVKYGKFLKYNQTVCYKELDNEDKKRYKKYLNNKKKKELTLSILLGLSLFTVLFFNAGFTGNVIGIDNKSNNVIIFSILLIVLVLLIIAYFVFKKLKNKKYNPLFKPLENIAFKKHL